MATKMQSHQLVTWSLTPEWRQHLVSDCGTGENDIY